MAMSTEGKRKPLYQPWNEEAFRADERVYAMTAEQRWMYRTSLQSAFFCSTRPYLPDDDAQLWMLAGCKSRQQWDENKDVVRSMFTAVELDGVSLLSQKRLLADWNRLEEKRQMLAENGRKGRKAQLKPSNSPTDAKRTPGNCSAIGGQEKLREVKRSEVREERKSRASHVAPKTGAVELPDWIPVDTWNDFVEMRTTIRKPLTSPAMKLAIKDLARLKAEGHDPKSVLEQSILRGWAGLFPLGGNASSVKPGSMQQRREELPVLRAEA